MVELGPIHRRRVVCDLCPTVLLDGDGPTHWGRCEPCQERVERRRKAEARLRADLYEHLIREEGERLEPYRDSRGFWTVGVGHLIDRRAGGSLPPDVRGFPLTPAESRRMLRDDVARHRAELARACPWVRELSGARRLVLVAMAFQLGVPRLLEFRRTLSHVRAGQWDDAAREMLDSTWARADSPARARRLAAAMRSGSTGLLEPDSGAILTARDATGAGAQEERRS